LRETQLELQRLARVVPLLLELDQINEELAGYLELHSLREDFGASACVAWQKELDAQESLSKAEESKTAVEAEIGALLISAERMQ
jgi:hypothetical protein